MRHYYKFETNSKGTIDPRIKSCLEEDKGSYPLLKSFVFSQETFYKGLGGMHESLFREKRLLVFESPNRAKITHEYDYEGFRQHNESCQFLFLPDSKLSWLQIRLNGQRVIIASQTKVKSIVYEKLKEELDKMVREERFSTNSEQVFDDLWHETKSNPCFVYLPEKMPESFLIEISYYSSVVKDSDKKTKYDLKLVDERLVEFQYKVNAPNNPWLYIQAPNKYEVNVEGSDSLSYRPNEVDKDDAGIVSRYMIKTNGENDTCTFKICIKVPQSLTIWYNALLVAAVVLIITLVVQIFSVSSTELVPVPLAMAVVAAFIATRGWMIQDETILSRYSKWATILMIVLIVLLIIAKLVISFK